LSENLELTLQTEYNIFNAKLKKTEPIRLAGIEGEGVDGEFEHSIDSKISSAGFSPLVSYRIGKQLRLHGGIRIGLLLDKKYEQIERIVKPDYGVFVENNRRTRAEFSGDIPGNPSIEAALVGGVSFDLPISSNYEWFLVPEAGLSFGLTNLSSNGSWSMNALFAGIGLRYAPREYIPPKPPPPPPPPPPLPPPPPPPTVPVLDATILAVGLASDGSETDVPILKVEEFLSTRMHPILNYIFFDENSAEIPSRYKRMSEEERKEFSVKQLYNLKTMEVYYHILNIIGKRMEFYPQAVITLTGCNSDEGLEKGNLNLSRQRAESVKNYLVNEWSIPPERIKIEARNLPEVPSNPATQDGIEENRRVEMSFNLPQVSEPMIIRDTIREANPPNIRFKLNIKSEIGVKSWNVITSQKGRNLKVFTGSGYPPVNIDWDIKKEEEQRYVPRFDEPLEYKLQVIDNDNKIWESSVEILPVEQLTIEKKMMEMIEDKELDKFSLILFPFGKADLSKENLSIAELAKNRIQKWSTVNITGYTDRVGEEDFNLKLSQRRAETTARAIGVDLKNAIGVGEKVLLFDNTYPEGRFYCRTVNIEIATPIQ
jgi:outer membrane protein OmpA-like peptidoglycan-associated protein